MRLVLASMVLALAACGKPTKGVENAQSLGQSPASCDRVVTKPVTFTAPDATDTVETRSFGADCETAVVVFTLRNRQGGVLWTYSASYETLATAEDLQNRQAMEAFLARWASVSVTDTAAAPHWPSEEATPPKEWGPTGQSSFSQIIYERIRSDRRPSFCMKRTTESSDCVFYDPDVGAVEVLYRIAG